MREKEEGGKEGERRERREGRGEKESYVHESL